MTGPLPEFLRGFSYASAGMVADEVGDANVSEECLHTSSSFDRSVCPEPCGSMHYYCEDCGERTDFCGHDAVEAMGDAVTHVSFSAADADANVDTVPEDDLARPGGDHTCCLRDAGDQLRVHIQERIAKPTRVRVEFGKHVLVDGTVARLGAQRPGRKPTRDEIAAVLIAEGAGPDNTIHSWRCEYPAHYGPCDCVARLADALLDLYDRAAKGEL